MLQIVKMTLKLLFRNIGFWFFMIVMPTLSIFIMCINQDAELAYYQEKVVREVTELDGVDSKVAYYGKQGEFVIKAYDASGSELSDFFLNRLAQSGIFLVCRAKAPELSKVQADQYVEEGGFEDRMGAAIYLSKEFDEALLKGDEQKAFTVYVLSEDERFSLLESELRGILQELQGAMQLADIKGDMSDTAVMKNLEDLHAGDPAKELESIAKKGEADFTREQINNKTHMGYAFSFLTLCFVFCGVFVAHTAIEEEKHKVFTRICLTGTRNFEYFVAKFAVSFIVSLMIAGILGILTLTLQEDQLGMGRVSFLLMVFLMGLIFNSLSLLFGILSGDIMTSNYVAFTLFTMSSLLSGLYFPLDDASKMVRTISYLMPQRWFMDSIGQIFMGDKKGYVVVLCITVAYLMIILSIGGVGLKMKRIED